MLVSGLRIYKRNTHVSHLHCVTADGASPGSSCETGCQERQVSRGPSSSRAGTFSRPLGGVSTWLQLAPTLELHSQRYLLLAPATVSDFHPRPSP